MKAADRQLIKYLFLVAIMAVVGLLGGAVSMAPVV